MSVLNDVLDKVVEQVDLLGLALDGTPLPVVKRKLPKKEELVDPPYQITVSKSEEPEGWRWYAFPSTSNPKGAIRKEYLVEITTITPNDNDQLTDLDTYTEWREQVIKLFSHPKTFAGIAQVFDCNAAPGVFLKREEVSNNYDYQQVGVRVITLEQGP